MSGTISTLAHHVYFWLKNPESKDDVAKLISGVKTLTSIETIKGFHISTPAATEDRNVIDTSYSVSWLAFFDSEADEQIYQVHETHLKFIADHEHLWSKVVVYDSVDATK
ncbi:MAG: Dabb family protein [Gammaproteobacteria bacterium]|nr:MAG: Dabb family protein [Gammaproteobacteria bacterium]